MGRIQNILVIDDSEEVREFVSLLLEDAGYTVEQAVDGVEGFELVRRHRPDLIVLDVIMPRMDGLDLLLKLRSDLAPPLPPTILCSGFDLTEAEALARGACRFLRKPVSPGDLLEAVSEVESGRLPSAKAIQAGRARATSARKRVLEEASRLREQIESHGDSGHPRFEALAAQQIEMLAHYLGVPAGMTALVRDDRLTVAASTGQHSIHIGDDLGAVMPPGYEVLETGSALVLADASAHPSFANVASALGGVRYFIGVPLRGPSGLPVGVICLFDYERREVEAEDLSTLQQFGRNGSAALALLARGELARLYRLHGGGIWARPVFELVLDSELKLLERHGGSMTLAVLPSSNLDSVRTELRRTPDRERLMCGFATDTHLLLCKRALDDSAGEVIDELLGNLAGPLALTSIGQVDLEGHGPAVFTAVQMIRLAQVALDYAEDCGGGTVTLKMCARTGAVPSTHTAFEIH
jgi:CheY-like chemotaxis protein